MSERILDDYLDYMKVEKEFSKNTLDAYRRDIFNFYNYIKNKRKLESILEVSEDEIEEYLNYLKEEGRANSTVSRSLASIRSIYQYLLGLKLIGMDPTSDLKTLPTKREIPETLTMDEVDLLLSKPDINTLKGSRDRAMIQLIVTTGLKVSEMLSLNQKDIDLNNRKLRLETNEEIREIELDGETLKTLNIYTEKYNQKFDNDGALFINIYGGRLSRQGFWKILRGYAKKANLEKNVTPHTLRHSFATRMIKEGVELEEVQRMLGHSSISTTEVYLKNE